MQRRSSTMVQPIGLIPPQVPPQPPLQVIMQRKNSTMVQPSTILQRKPSTMDAQPTALIRKASALENSPSMIQRKSSTMEIQRKTSTVKERKHSTTESKRKVSVDYTGDLKLNVLMPSFLQYSGSKAASILNDALVPDSMIACWIKQKIEDEFENIVYQEIDKMGNLTPETWKIVAYNIIKKIEISPDISEFLRSVQCIRSNIQNSSRPVERISTSNTLQMQQLAFDMSTQSTISTKMRAFEVLLQSQLLFTLTTHETYFKHWPRIREILYQGLQDESDDIFFLSLKAHARLINSAHPQHVKEGFRSLLSGYNLFYSTGPKPRVKDNNFSIEEPMHLRLARIMHLLLYAINKIPRIYIRSNNIFIEAILSGFFDSLSMFHEEKSTILSSYLVVSILDPKANWFTNVLHGVHAQNHIFDLLATNSLVRKIVDRVGNPEDIREPTKYASYMHTTRMFSAVVRYAQGRRLFPMTTLNEEEPITLEKIYLQAVNYLNSSINVALEDMVVDGLPMLVKTGVLKSDSPLMRAIFHSLPMKVPTHMARALESIAETREGLRCLMGAHDVKTLLDSTLMVLKDQLLCTAAVKISLLRTTGRILQGHRGFCRFKDTELIPKAATSFQHQRSKTSEPSDGLNEELFRFLTNVASTPLGILTLSRHSALLPQLQSTWAEDDSETFRRCSALANIFYKEEELEYLIISSIINVPHATVPKDRITYGNSELYRFLKSTKSLLHDNNWYACLKRAYKASSAKQAKTYVVLEMLDHVTQRFAQRRSATPRIKPETSATVDLLIVQAAKWIIGYGESNHLLNIGQRHLDNLLELFYCYRRSETDGFSFFLGIAFLISGGHVDKSCNFLNKVALLPSSAFFWPHKSSAHFQSFGFKYGHLMELLVEEELPVVAKALKMSGVMSWQISRRWIAQCFLNILTWEQICQWLIYCLMSSPEHCVYFCVALFRHLQADLLRAADSGNLDHLYLKSIRGFHITEYMGFMDKLAKRKGNLKL